MVTYRAALQGMLTGVMLAVARIAGETAPLLFTALNNQFWSSNLNAPDGQPAGGHLPVRDEPLCRLADAGLGRRAADHRRDPRCSTSSPELLAAWSSFKQ